MTNITGRNNKALRTKTATIDISSSDTVSDAVDIGSAELVAIVMPGTWTSANLKIQAAAPGTTTFNVVQDAAGDDVIITNPVADKHIVLSYAGIKGLNSIKLVSTNAQAADREITLILKEE